MNIENQLIRKQLKTFFAAHSISSPHDRPVNTNDGVTICSCGARWHTFYSRHGLEWKPLNDQCAIHDAAQAKLPIGYGLSGDGALFKDD